MATKSNENALLVTKKDRAIFLVTLTCMSMAGLVGSDVYLPTLPAIGQALGASTHSMQWTLGIYLIGLSIGQLILGPLSERFGRKNLLLVCMLVYGMASIACASSSHFFHLLIFRLLQSLGACGGLVIGRAIIGDLFQPKEAGKIFSTIFPFVGMSPAISPAIGGFIGHYLGWRANFVFVALFAFAVFLLVILRIPESKPLLERKSLHGGKIISTYFDLLTNRTFLYYVVTPCTAYVAFFAYVAQSPFIFHAHGFGDRAIGISYITLSLTYVIGGLVSRSLLQRLSIDEALAVGFKFFLLGATLFLIGGMLHVSLLLMVLAISVLTFGNGFLIPLGTAGVVTSSPGVLGYASGLLGFLQLGVAGLTSAYIGAISLNNMPRLAVFICFAAISGFVIRTLLSPRKVVCEVSGAQ